MQMELPIPLFCCLVREEKGILELLMILFCDALIPQNEMKIDPFFFCLNTRSKKITIAYEVFFDYLIRVFMFKYFSCNDRNNAKN